MLCQLGLELLQLGLEAKERDRDGDIFLYFSLGKAFYLLNAVKQYTPSDPYYSSLIRMYLPVKCV
jgi:hypothetical protein